MSETSKQERIDAACPGCTPGEWGADDTMVVTPPIGAQLQAIEEMQAGRRTEPFTSRRIALCDPSPYVTVSQAAANARVMGAGKELLAACKAALTHVEELREAWMRGALAERDNLGGTRSNRNVQVESVLRAAIAKVEGAKP